MTHYYMGTIAIVHTQHQIISVTTMATTTS
jgi:hypothetical protein